MTTDIKTAKSDVVIVGAGAAGLMTALTLAASDARLDITVLSPVTLGQGCASAWSQGGIAAAVGKNDSVESHLADTLKAGAGISDVGVSRALTQAGPAVVEKLAQYGVRFAREGLNDYALSREACHAERRVLRAAAGDGFGAELMRALINAVTTHPKIKIVTGFEAERLVRREGASMGPVVGLLARNTNSETVFFKASAVVLATGGIGALYAVTTNPLAATGRGIAMAARAGAVLADLEFVQFHPTALDIGEDPAPLATEALRGEGAVLRNSRGQRFMMLEHPMAELAPRDVVSRGLFTQIERGQKTYLDCRTIDTAKFPALLAACARAGLDPKRDLIPVAPAVHYHMGGIATDIQGRSSLSGLWAVGEVAATGLHGANRLASNSLLEAVAMGMNAASDIVKRLPLLAIDTARHIKLPALPPREKIPPMTDVGVLRQLMTNQVGVVREGKGLCDALAQLQDLSRRAEGIDAALADRVLVAKLIAASALMRQESRGGHARRDYPETSPAFKKRSFVTLKEIEARLPALLPVAPARQLEVV